MQWTHYSALKNPCQNVSVNAPEPVNIMTRTHRLFFRAMHSDFQSIMVDHKDDRQEFHSLYWLVLFLNTIDKMITF